MNWMDHSIDQPSRLSRSIFRVPNLPNARVTPEGGTDTNPLMHLPKAPPAPGRSESGWDLPNLPDIAQPGQGGGIVADLPAPPPPKRKASAFDDDHYQQTMLAIAAGFFGSNNFGDGLANAAKSIYNQNDMIRQEGRPTLGGPDDAFEIYTDPQTGEHVFKPIQAAIDYQTQKRFDPADQADLLGRAMYSILQLPEADRPGAYSRWLSGPDTFGVDTRNLPHTWDPQFAAITSNMGMTVSQARTRDQAASNADQAEAARQAALGLRREMVGIAQRRADASISQGQQRIGIAQAALAKRGSGSGGKGSHKPISEQSDAELLSIIFGD